MNFSVKNCLRVRNMLSFLKSKRGVEELKGGKALSEEDQDRLKSMVSKIRIDEAQNSATHTGTLSVEEATKLVEECDMDIIRARGKLKYRFNYKPPTNLKETVKAILHNINPELTVTSDKIMDISLAKNIKLKFMLLDMLGKSLNHVIRNSDLHKMRTVGDVVDFYSRPVSNLTKYTQMARGISGSFPENLCINEHPFRFHPEDKDAYHGGVTAFPGTGGEVYGLRNKRLFRQFQPKKDWFDYEDQSFNYTRMDKDMPWDPVIVERMDHYPNKRYNLKTKKFRNVNPGKNEIFT